MAIIDAAAAANLRRLLDEHEAAEGKFRALIHHLIAGQPVPPDEQDGIVREVQRTFAAFEEAGAPFVRRGARL